MLSAFNIEAASEMKRDHHLAPSRAKEKRKCDFSCKDDVDVDKVVVMLRRQLEEPPTAGCYLLSGELVSSLRLRQQLMMMMTTIMQRDSGNEGDGISIRRKRMRMRHQGKRKRRRRRKRKRELEEKKKEEEEEDLVVEEGRRNRRQGRRVVTITTATRGIMSIILCLLTLSLAAPENSLRLQVVGAELGEGLSLNQGKQLQNNQHQLGLSKAPEWPVQLEQLERIKEESRVSAQVGQNVVLNCAVQFKDGLEKPFVVNWLKYPHKLPIYIWYAGYPAHVAPGYENRVARIGQASLNLSRVRESDQGLYECKIYYLDRRPDEEGNGTWIFLDVQAPPHFTQSPAPISYVQAGNSLQLTCQAESTPAPVLRWYKNKLPIDSDSGPYRLVSSSGSSSGANSADGGSSDVQLNEQDAAHQELLGARQSSQLELHIDQVLAGTTTGDYRCLASNSEGSVEARAQVALAVPAVITLVPKNQSKLEGERAELQCQAKALPANITHKWLFNEKPVHTLKWFEGRHSVRRDGTLIINSLHRDDQGKYTCQVSNGIPHHQNTGLPASTSTSTSTSTSISTSNPNRTSASMFAEASAFLDVEYPARISQSPSPQYLPLGLSGLIRCFVQAAPPVEFFTWTLNNQQFEPNLDPNIERLSNGSLLVRKVLKHYEGSYRCTPFNKHGSAGSSAAMEVKVEEPPVFELRPADFYKAPAGGHVSIPCEGRGSPRPTVSWRRVMGSFVSSLTSSGSARWSPSSSSSPFAAAAQPTLVDQAFGDEPELGDHEQLPELPVAASSVTFSSATAAGTHSATDEPSNSRQQHDDEQQSVIIHAPLPSDRSDFKNSHLIIQALRKEDHGRYECLIENEVATLIASTMLYIEETTPHAPTDVQVSTKTWSAQVSWQPGYDGGFDQSFVVRYRQVAKASQKEEKQAGPKGKQLQHEPLDLNWHTAQVVGEATTFTVQNLSQDTSYEFHVRARNIIGEGPRSPSVFASTKRAISGSITPVISSEAAGSSGQEEKFPRQDDEDEQQELPSSSLSSTLNPSVLGIIHLVDYSSSSTPIPSASTLPVGVSVSDLNHHPFGHSSASSSSPSVQQQHNNSSSTTLESDELSAASEQQQQQQQQPQPASNSSKVIRIYFPYKANSRNSSSSSSVALASPAGSGDPTGSSQQTNKRPRFGQPDSTSTTSLPSDPTQVCNPIHPPAPTLQLDDAPHNLSMSKVAQGWVLSWSPPKRFPPPVESALVVGNSAPPISAEVAASQLSSGSFNTPTSTPSYALEYREKGGAWQSGIMSKERSFLLKDLRPGSEYLFRIFALHPNTASGARGPPSPELKYTIPDNRRKPGSTQALSAGVVSGFLFFVACIVIAVCAVNMCNKRRKKRAEKAAYVMMACPVLESHHDIAALNSNSLMKNSSTAKGRVSGVMRALGVLSLCKSWGLCRLLSGEKQTDVKKVTGQLKSGKGEQLLTRRIKFGANEPHPVDVTPCYVTCPGMAAAAAIPEEPQAEAESSGERTVDKHLQKPAASTSKHLDEVDRSAAAELDGNGNGAAGRGTLSSWASSSSNRPLDDYWLHKPADRKWGTLTVAGSRLAERRARETSLRLQGTYQVMESEHNNSLQPPAQEHLGGRSSFESLTVPRPFRQPAAFGQQQWQVKSAGRDERSWTAQRGADQSVPRLTDFSCRRRGEKEEQFSSWLREQLAGGGERGEGGAESDRLRGQSPVGRPLGEAVLVLSEQQRAADGDLEAARQQQAGPTAGKSAQLALKCSALQHQQQLHHYQLHPGELAPAFVLTNHQRRSLSSGQIEPLRSALSEFAQRPASNQRQTMPLVAHLAYLAPSEAQRRQMLVRAQEDLATLERLLQQSSRQPQIVQLSPSLLKVAATTAEQPQPHQQQPLTYLASELHSSLPAGHKSPPTCQGVLASNWPEAANYPAGSFQRRPAAAGEQQLNDDPLTLSENACLGSYKRKRRLPHIEAQFTISSPPAPSSSGPPRGNLFVRPRPATSRSLPPGFPTPGQRTEQLRLKRQLQLPFGAANGAPQVASIDAREKIETYLRQYNNPDESPRQQQHHYLSQREKSSLNVRIGAHTTPIQLHDDQPEELIFQPYENLPGLKYSIILPIQRGPNGSLLLNETSHLRRSGRRDKGNQPSQMFDETSRSASYSTPCTDSNPATCERAFRSRRSKRRLASSSSCPEPELEDHSRNIPKPPEKSDRLKGRSLESALGWIAVKQAALIQRAESTTDLQPDSLETSIENSQADPPSYPRSLTPSPPDLEGLRASLLRDIPPPPAHSGTPSPSPPPIYGVPNKPSSADIQLRLPQQPPPPPVPPHRIRRPAERKKSAQIKKKGEQPSTSSSSPASSTTSSSSNSTECGTSEALTNEHSVDENYEFDLISSCSSSTAKRNKQHHQITSTNSNGATIKQQSVNGDIYTQVNKQQKKKQVDKKSPSASSLNHHHDTISHLKPQHTERARYFHGSSRKEQQLTTTNKPSSSYNEMKLINQINNSSNSAHYYDTVYDDIRDDQGQLEESSKAN